MNVRFTQIVDYWVGVPLCAFISFVDALITFFHKNEFQSPKRMLFIELSEMGSTFLAYPMLLKAIEQVGDPKNVSFLIFKSNAESVRLLGLLPEENILTINDKSFGAFLLSTLKTLFMIRSRGFDTVVDLELFSRFTTLLSYFSGAVNRVGFSNYTEEGLYRGSLITHPAWYNPFVHISQNFLHLLEALSGEKKERPWPKKVIATFPEGIVPDYRYEQSRRAEMCSRLEAQLGESLEGCKLFLLNPDPGQLPLRGWPLESYARVVKELEEMNQDICFIICGMKSSHAYAEKLYQLVQPKRFINFCGETANLQELTILLDIVDCFLTSDSGPGHMVTLTDTPAIVLFGPETPHRYRPLGKNIEVEYADLACSPCYTAANHRHSCCTDNICMQRIEPSSVIEKAKKHLEAI